MIRILIFAMLLVALGAGTWSLAGRSVRAVELMLERHAASALAALGARWAGADANGLLVELSGHAPSEEERALALAALRSALPLASVQDNMTATQAPPDRRAPVELELHREGDSVVVMGSFAGGAMRADFLIALAEALPGTRIHDLSGVDASAPPAEWGPESVVAIEAIARISPAFVRVEPGHLLVEGVVADDAGRRALEADLMARAGPLLAVETALRSPRPVLTPFRLSASRAPEEPLIVARCAARTDAERARIEAVIARLGGVHAGDRTCVSALGGPALDWAAAADAGLRALGALEAGHLELAGRQITLASMAPVTEAAFEEALTLLAFELPEGFRLNGEYEAEAAALSEARAGTGLWLRLRVRGGAIALQGRVPGEAERLALIALVRSAGAQVEPEIALEVHTADVRPDFQIAALALVEAVMAQRASLVSAAAHLTSRGLALQARMRNPRHAGRLHRRIAGNLPAGLRFGSRITIDLPAAVAAIDLTPERCVHVLNSLVLRRPFEFESGASQLGEGADTLIAEIAETLRRCPGAAIEIGGHTDNRGRAELNARLSAARAEAVRRRLAAALGAGAGVELTARGFGQANPVASNDTEEGRARNRRIAFRLGKG